MIHQTAIISSEAIIGKNVAIGAYSIIEKDVQIGDNCKIAPHVRIASGTRLGENVEVESFAFLGGNPQDIHFDKSKKTYLIVGKNSVIRENVSLHRASIENEATVIGENAYIMACAHVGHDCKIGKNLIMANGSMFAGHCTVGDDVFISGTSVVHQKTHIGQGVMLGGNCTITQSVPPFLMIVERNLVGGLNLVRLKRMGCSSEQIRDIKKCYSYCYKDLRVKLNAQEAIANGLAVSDIGKNFLDFIINQKLALATKKYKDE